MTTFSDFDDNYDDDVNAPYNPGPKPRWEKDLDHPVAYSAIYLSDRAIKDLKYTLSHVTGYENMTLSEAIQKLCDEWISLGNDKMRCEREHSDAEEDAKQPHPYDPFGLDHIHAGVSGDGWCGNPESHPDHQWSHAVRDSKDTWHHICYGSKPVQYSGPFRETEQEEKPNGILYDKKGPAAPGYQPDDLLVEAHRPLGFQLPFIIDHGDDDRG